MPKHTHIAKYVRPERCAHCGHKKITWSPRKIVESALEWTETHGRLPRAKEWTSSGLNHPPQQVVTSVFGTWNNMLKAAGLDERPRDYGSGPTWGKDEIANAMLDFLARHGRWPKGRDWQYSSSEARYPSYLTVIRAFGSWLDAKRYAGWDGSSRCAGCNCPRDEYTAGCRACQARRRHRAIKNSPAFAGSVEPLENRLPAPDGGAGEPPSQREREAA